MVSHFILNEPQSFCGQRGPACFTYQGPDLALCRFFLCLESLLQIDLFLLGDYFLRQGLTLWPRLA